MTIKPRSVTKRGLYLPALLGLAFLGSGAAIWFLVPPKIAARTQVYVAVEPPYILFRPESDPIDRKAYLHSQAYHVRDRFVLSAALRDPEIAQLSILKEKPDPLQWLEDAIGVEFPSPEIMYITLSGDQPEKQQKIVSAVTKAYLDNVVNRERTQKLARHQILKEVFERFENRTQTKRRVLRETMDRAQNRAAAIDVSQLRDDLARDEEVMRKVGKKLMELEVEQDAPQRIIWPDKEAVLTPDSKPSPWIVAASASLAGLGILLLAFASLRFCVYKVTALFGHSLTPSLPE